MAYPFEFVGNEACSKDLSKIFCGYMLRAQNGVQIGGPLAQMCKTKSKEAR